VSGLDSEVYELRCFPPHLVGLPFGLVAQHLYDTRHLILMGLGYKNWRSSQRQYRMMPLEMVRSAAWTTAAQIIHIRCYNEDLHTASLLPSRMVVQQTCKAQRQCSLITCDEPIHILAYHKSA
jgi:hypothetical protein